MDTPWGPIGYFVYKRTYARRLAENKPDTEEWAQTVERVLSACEKQLKCGFSKREEERLRNYMLQLKGTVAGRFLWQLGTRTVKNLGLASLQNCATTVVNEPIRPFTWAMDMLMLGSGVGYNIQREYVYELPKAKKVKITRLDEKDADFIVPDTREGWVELLRKTLESHFYTGKGFSYSTICVRSKGSEIKGFGGIASGPDDLCVGIERINGILNKRAGKKVRPIDCLDIMNIIGQIVVAGNVRRSAQIAIGDMDDLQFLNAKRWDLGNVPNWRAYSNNSVVCNDINMLPEQFWQGYKGNGEPYGLINLNLSREIGRIGEDQYKDPEVCGYNPCAEQSLAPYETCCLAEVFLPNIESKEELLDVAKLLYRVNKHSLALKCHHPETEKIVHKNMRMGIGVTGYLQATKKQRKWLPEVYDDLRIYDRKYSNKHGFPASIKLTTVKPSGTLSLLAGVTSGGHPGFSRYYIRRVRVSSDSSLVELCRAAGYPVEYQLNFDGTEDKSMVVISFPCKLPSNTVLEEDVTAVDQLNTVKELQNNWSDNAVSVTIYYREKELPAIKDWLLKNYNENVKSCSFLKKTDHGFSQAPLEEISKEVYDEMVKVVQPIEKIKEDVEKDVLDEFECEGGACPVK